MARTWSAPQRGSFALVKSEARQQNLLARLADAGWADRQRGLLLLIAAFLTAAGIVVPHIPAETLSKLLFLAGASLATILISVHRQPASLKAGFPGAARPSPRATRGFHEHTRFAELTAKPKVDHTLDRAVWAKLTAHMSHELRTPLNAVLGFSELMSNEVFGPLGSSCYGAYARDIHASGRLLLKSAEDALAITALLTSADRKGLPHASPLRAVTDDACDFARYDLGARSITIETGIELDVEVLGDAQAMRQMLINLMIEASRNTRSGGVLHVETRATPDFVRLSIHVADCDIATPARDDAFPMILARTLCELSGAQLALNEAEDGSREWTVDFLPVAQNDLFAERAS